MRDVSGRVQHLSVAGQLWNIAAFGGGLLLFALLVIGGTWAVLHRLSKGSAGQG